MSPPVGQSFFLIALASLSTAAGLYPSSSNILQIDAASYPRLIERSNRTSILEFYAPWCGHCRNLAPAYENAATTLKGMANVAAVNCDEDANKPFCGQMGIQGFPTLKIVRPSKDGKRKKPIVSDYAGPREAKPIIDAVKEKMNSHVTRVTDDKLASFMSESKDKPVALFFSEKGLVPTVVKSLAIDFLGSLRVGYSRSTDKAVASKYGVTKFPGVVVIPADGSAHKTYDGEFKRNEILTFLSQEASPNPDAADTKEKLGAKASARGQTKPKAQKAPKPPHASETIVEDDPKESPGPAVTPEDKPVKLPVPKAEPLTELDTEAALQKACLHSKSSTCVLAVLPDARDAAEEQAKAALLDLSQIANKHRTRGAKLFPIYSIPASNPGAKLIVDALGLKKAAEGVQVLAVNAKRDWWSHFESDKISQASLERWIDGIRFGEMKKQKLPSGLVKEAMEEAKAEDKVAGEPDAGSKEHEEL